ncbi:TPA: hypothetical protein IUX45_002825 [Enterococcus faecalis]|uniref:Uncharacterized protein n=2 Tax=Bacilli TaxID=91061 RepID=A0A640MNF5_BACAN|nr:hypothetical protein [Enterococcus faecalis]GEU15286.1 hypothetical protein QuyetLC_48800 [Bacillus anthracis]EGO7767576.1 hypothetical protein [Enterococcus faecalis]EIQ7141182.1 hypothetical protein [Enterococcus faecalis]EKE4879829.1 hypothetical protein [Enterococcus faecalis]EMC2444973.1 hypothetical protein [Enterococcus faecalis]
MKNKEIKQLEELGLEEQIEIYYALVSDFKHQKYTTEQSETLALYIVLRANAITNSIFEKDF